LNNITDFIYLAMHIFIYMLFSYMQYNDISNLS